MVEVLIYCRSMPDLVFHECRSQVVSPFLIHANYIINLLFCRHKSESLVLIYGTTHRNFFFFFFWIHWGISASLFRLACEAIADVLNFSPQ